MQECSIDSEWDVRCPVFLQLSDQARAIAELARELGNAEIDGIVTLREKIASFHARRQDFVGVLDRAHLLATFYCPIIDADGTKLA